MFISGPIQVYHPEYLSDAEIFILAKIFITNISKLSTPRVIYDFINYMILNPNPNSNPIFIFKPGYNRFDLGNLKHLLIIPSKVDSYLFLFFDGFNYLNDNQVHFELLFIFICILIKKSQLEAPVAQAVAQAAAQAAAQAPAQVSPLEIKEFNIGIHIKKINLSLFTKSFNTIIFGLKKKIIKKLILESTSIGNDEAIKLANALQTNTTLLELDFNDNTFNNVGILVANALETNTMIERLFFYKTKVDNEGAARLGHVLATNKTLKELTLSWLDDKDTAISFIQEFASILSFPSEENKTLKSLDFSFNKLGMEGSKTLVEALSNTHLSVLVLCGNEIGKRADAAEADKAFYEALSKTTITNLSLTYNQIGDDVAKELANVLETNTTLKILKLGFNRFYDEGATELATALKTNTTLTTLDIKFNFFTDVGAKELANALETNTTLKILNLESNMFTDEGGEALADALETNTTLTTLNLGGNIGNIDEIKRNIKNKLARNAKIP